MNIRILQTAEDDFVEGYRFYERQEPGAGDYFLNTLYSEIDSLARYAGIHRKVFGKFRMLSRTFPVGIFYTITGNTVEVRAILDLRRKPFWLKNRLGS